MSILDDLNEICIEIRERIKLNAIKVKEIDNILNVIIQLPNSKIKEINFELNAVEQNEKEIIKKLTKLVIKLNNEIIDNKNIQNKEIRDLKEINLNQNKEIMKLNDQLNKLDSDFKNYQFYQRSWEKN